ncbi:MAG: sulfite exporter TauE/SafE family protein, partial [Candidatus Methylomirabilales bacterium]
IMLHRRRGFVMVPLILWVGVTALIGSMTGALTSKVVSNKLIETVFAAGAVLGGLLMSMPIRHEGRFAPERPIGFHHGRAIGIGLGCGVFAGMTGVGGSFLLIPLMRSTLEIPLRVVVGSNLGIVLLTALSGSIGKVVTGQVRLSLAVTVVLGAIPGALLGSRVSTIVSERILRSLLMVLIFLTAILMWGGVFLKNT